MRGSAARSLDSPTSATAQTEIHGFVETAIGVRSEPGASNDSSTEQIRAQLQFSDYSDKG